MKKTSLTLALISTLVTASVMSHESHSHTSSTPTSVAKPRGNKVMGTGEHTYENVSAWGLLKDNAPLGPLHGGVAVDRAGLIYFSTDTKVGVRVFSPEGKQIKTIGGAALSRCHSLFHQVENDKDVFYAAAQGSKFIKFDSEGNVLLTIPNEKTGEFPLDAEGTQMGTQFKGTTGITVDREGNLYGVCGYGNNLCYKFDKTGKYIKSFGGRGAQDGKFKTCHGIVIDNRYDQPRLLVSDRESNRLQHFDLEGYFLGVHATGLRRPCATSIHGDFTASAELAGGVAIYDKDGNFITRLGDNPDKSQWANFRTELADMEEGFFTAPHGLSYDKDGNLYVLEWNKNGRLSKLVKKAK